MLSRASRGERDVIFGFFGKVLPAQGPLRGRAALMIRENLRVELTLADLRHEAIQTGPAVRITILDVHEEGGERGETRVRP